MPTVAMLDPWQYITGFRASGVTEYISFGVAIVGQEQPTRDTRDDDPEYFCAVPVPSPQTHVVLNPTKDYGLHLAYQSASILGFRNGAWGARPSGVTIEGIPSSSSGDHFVQEISYGNWYGEIFEQVTPHLNLAHFTPVASGDNPSVDIPVPFNDGQYFNANTEAYGAQVGFLTNPESAYVCISDGANNHNVRLAIGNIFQHVIGTQAQIASLLTVKVNGAVWPIVGAWTKENRKTAFDNIDAPGSILFLCQRPGSD